MRNSEFCHSGNFARLAERRAEIKSAKQDLTQLIVCEVLILKSFNPVNPGSDIHVLAESSHFLL